MKSGRRRFGTLGSNVTVLTQKLGVSQIGGLDSVIIFLFITMCIFAGLTIFLHFYNILYYLYNRSCRLHRAKYPISIFHPDRYYFFLSENLTQKRLKMFTPKHHPFKVQGSPKSLNFGVNFCIVYICMYECIACTPDVKSLEQMNVCYRNWHLTFSFKIKYVVRHTL